MPKCGPKSHSTATVSNNTTPSPRSTISPFTCSIRLIDHYMCGDVVLLCVLADNPPGSFCWDYLCGDEDGNPQVQDRDDLEDKNVDQRVADFIAAAYYMASFRKGDLATMNVQWNMVRSQQRHTFICACRLR